MLGPRLVPLAGIGWSFGVIALLLKSPLIASPQVTITTDDPLALSIAVLKQSESFKASAVGIAGITPNEVLAWRVVFNSPNRDEAFQSIIASGSISGQLYALAGLWFGDATQFAAALKVVSRRGGAVQTLKGCIGGSQPLSELLREIQTGSWSTDFLSAGRIVMVR
jgi:hypothetical protein